MYLCILADLVERQKSASRHDFCERRTELPKRYQQSTVEIWRNGNIHSRSYLVRDMQAIGLGPEVMDMFQDCQSRIGGVGFKELEQEA